ncbi:Hypothetical protein SMAX5B_001608 [Scophthalmus maximus]|uniref:Uncharacterized protein n=1 Tax=Scophthalmus maximus TaxID=52904 RepID=A0A2U9BPX8_SCOMX|nr:Hypothetical protein SMAX5B_001608 [Scophthalmus maximus]
MDCGTGKLWFSSSAVEVGSREQQARTEHMKPECKNPSGPHPRDSLGDKLKDKQREVAVVESAVRHRGAKLA